MSSEKPRRLGRGLEALIGSAASVRVDSSTTSAPSPDIRGPRSDTVTGPVGEGGVSASPIESSHEFRQISLARIRPNPFQPRRDFSESELGELRASLSSSGMLQPVVVRPSGDHFELISGERRLRAATQLGWRDVPALIRDADERMMLTLALIENLQRTDLNVVEEARGYQRLHSEFQLTHQQISSAVAKDRSTVTNLLRLLALPSDVLNLLEQGKLTMGHARALLAVAASGSTIALADEIVAGELSVRQTEQRVRALTSARSNRRSSRGGHSITSDIGDHGAEVRKIQAALRRRLQTDVKIQLGSDQRGTIQIFFYSADDLGRLLEMLTVKLDVDE